MSDQSTFEIVFEATTKLEGILEQKFGGSGKGLHAKAISIQGHLGAGLLKKIQFLATIRNNLAHTPDFKDEVPLERFQITSKQVFAALEALDPPDLSSLPPTEFGRTNTDRYGRGPVMRAAGMVGGTIAVIGLGIAAFISIAIIMNGRSRNADASSTHESTEAVRVKPEVPLWSIEHEKHAKQAFPWREEQAAFIAKGEQGALPNETLWRVVSPPREIKVKDAVQLEVDLVLGGGSLKGKARFPVSDGLEPTSALNPKIEIEAKLPPKTDIASMALKSDGSSDFSSFDPPYTCQRQVPTGCAAWNDHGVAYIAVSLVSFDNVLKIVYGDQHRSP